MCLLFFIFFYLLSPLSTTFLFFFPFIIFHLFIHIHFNVSQEHSLHFFFVQLATFSLIVQVRNNFFFPCFVFLMIIFHPFIFNNFFVSLLISFFIAPFFFLWFLQFLFYFFIIFIFFSFISIKFLIFIFVGDFLFILSFFISSI